jgi:hypothetical protein
MTTPPTPQGGEELKRKIKDAMFRWHTKVSGMGINSEIDNYADEIMRLISQSQAAAVNTVLDRVEKVLPQNKLFPAGLDNGMSDQMHGYNVAINQMRQALQRIIDEQLGK